jgi:hypothetical protein
MLVTMRIDLFPLISVAGLVPFLPPAFWEWVSPGLDRVRTMHPVRRWGEVVAARLPAGTVPDAPPLLIRWNQRNETDLENVSISFVEQPTIDAAREPTNRVQLERHDC